MSTCMFATANDTNRWAVMLDDRIQTFATRAQAEAVYALACPSGEHWDDQPFGAIQVIPPGYRPRSIVDGSDMTVATVSALEQSDLRAYIQSEREAVKARAAAPPSSSPFPATDAEWDALFGVAS